MTREYAYRGDMRELFGNPKAIAGGTLGMLLSVGILVLGFTVWAPNASADEDDEFELEFNPGTLVRLGEKKVEKDIPEKIVVEETVEEVEQVVETVTEEEEAKPAEEPPPPPPEEDPKKIDKPPPKKKPDPKKKKSKLPTAGNKKFDNDTPTATVLKGDPFGSRNGFSDLKKDGDPWATAVLAAFSNMGVGVFGAEAQSGDVRFQVTVCKDGRVKKVIKQGGSGSERLKGAVALAARQVKLPKPPADVARKMKSNCVKIRHTFRWQSSGVR